MRLSRIALIAGFCFGSLLSAHAQVSGGVFGETAGSPPSAQANPEGSARISAGVMLGLILTKVQPRYPAEARANHIQGTVVLHAIIGKDGHIEKLEPISGPEELRNAATDAVSQWTYRPYLLNGEPAEVDTTVVINFNLGPSPDAIKMVHEEQRPGISGGGLLSSVPPIYPSAAKATNLEGAVQMKAHIGKDGHVKNLEVVSGPEILQPAALKAVRQWIYHPYLLNGEPVETDIRVTVNFNLNGSGTSP